MAHLLKETLEDVNARFDAIKGKNSRVEDNLNGKKINVATEGNKEVKINKTSKPEVIEPVFSTEEDREEFNKWYNDTLEKSSAKKKVGLYDVPSKYDWEENDTMNKQLHSTSEVSDQQKLSATTPDSSSILFYLQAVFILLIAGHKSLNNNLLKFAKHSNFPNCLRYYKSFTCSTAPTCYPAGPPASGGC